MEDRETIIDYKLELNDGIGIESFAFGNDGKDWREFYSKNPKSIAACTVSFMAKMIKIVEHQHQEEQELLIEVRKELLMYMMGPEYIDLEKKIRQI